MTPVDPPTREDNTVPPAVTIKQSTVVQDGINVALFTVMEGGNAYAVEDSYDMAVQDAKSIFGEDVSITTGDTPATPAAAPEVPPAAPSVTVTTDTPAAPVVPPDPSVPNAGAPAPPTVATDPTTPA